MTIKKILLMLFAGIASTSCLMDKHGVVEARFYLAKDSRLPVWFKATYGYQAKSQSVEIRTYSSSKIRVIISSPDGKKIQEGLGTSRWHPDSWKDGPPGLHFPNWLIVNIDGTIEVYEQRGANNFFWIVDKPILN